jgi:hypothetical protein
MKKQHNFWPATIAALGLTISLIFFPVKAFAVVGNVELVGGPGLGETISFTDEKGNETQETTQERKDDRTGAVVIFIPLQGRNLPDGKYKIKWRGGETTATLGPGVNRVEFHAGGGEAPRYVFNLGTTTRFFSDSYGPLKASTGLRFEVGAPINFGEGWFAHQPYLALTYLPGLQFHQRDPWDFDGIFQAKLRRGSMVDVSAGVQTNWDYDLPRVGGAEVYGGYNVGVRYSHSSFTLERVNPPKPEFIDAHNFDKTDNAFGFELGYRVWLQWDNGFWAGLRGGFTPTYTDALNGGRAWKGSGDVGVFIGYSWAVPESGLRQRR